MELFYLFIVVVLVLLAISDLVVGVSNDAVNFVNSAIGSRTASFRAVMIIAAAGVLVGATFSSGMMEVARKGIFNPENFFFNEVMIIFLAVMITDVLLLDIFNTIGLPTSTTVSLVFELVGASFVISTIKIIQAGDTLAMYAQYLNTGKVVAIISGILLSIAIGFTVAAIIQYLVRILFTFRYQSKIKYFGALFGGLAFTAIIYFIFVKGAKGASFLTPEVVDWFKTNTTLILLVSFAGFTLLFQFLYWIFKLNILKVIVLGGTFALAMAFAGNDLVNFIGVPLAGLESYQIFTAQGGGDAGSLTMEVLRNPVKTPTLFLLIAGVIMVATLFLSKKARSVTKTTVDLGRQGEGDESFQSSLLARGIVSMTVQMSRGFSYIIPVRVQQAIDRRFEQVHTSKKSKDAPAFDMVRAAVILIVSSILITMGTNLKLPLSTTYITFMVAMGASLADRAWGRESAVYRVSGVITVIGGWFFTALIAFTVSGLIALVLHFTAVFGVIGFILLALFIVYRTHIIHKKKTIEESTLQAMEDTDQYDASSIYKRCEIRVLNFSAQVGQFYERTIRGLIGEHRGKLNKLGKEMKEFSSEIKVQRRLFNRSVGKLNDAGAIEAEIHHMQIFGQMKEIQNYLKETQKLCFEYVDNSHPAFHLDDKKELLQLAALVTTFSNLAKDIVHKRNFTDMSALTGQKEAIEELIVKMKIALIHKLKKTEITTRQSMAVMDLLTFTSNLTEHLHDLVIMQRRFYRKLAKTEI